MFCSLLFGLFQDGTEPVVKDVLPGDSVHSLLSILDIITVSPSFLPSVRFSRLDANFLSQMMTRRPLAVVPLSAGRGRQSLVFPRGEGAEAVVLSVVLSSLWV